MAEAAIKKKRPKNLKLSSIRLPLPGILSILHRISGATLFLLLPVFLALFERSLSSAEQFAQLKSCLDNPLLKIILLGLIWFYLHHFCAGIRYLLLDLHKGIDLPAARASSRLVFIVGILATLLIGGKVLW
ncbi:MAG: succinate dehydrogenase, cytochrome b556 subunit [Pseudomonadota bacterium]